MCRLRVTTLKRFSSLCHIEKARNFGWKINFNNNLTCWAAALTTVWKFSHIAALNFWPTKYKQSWKSTIFSTKLSNYAGCFSKNVFPSLNPIFMWLSNYLCRLPVIEMPFLSCFKLLEWGRRYSLYQRDGLSVEWGNKWIWEWML